MAEVTLLPYALCSFNDVYRTLIQDQSAEQPTAGSEHAALITGWINGLTETAQTYIGSLLSIEERTQRFNIHCDRAPMVQLPATPIKMDVTDPLVPVPMIEVRSDRLRIFGSDTVLDLWDDYVVNPKSGLLEPRHGWEFQDGPQALQVKWTGGIVVPLAANSSEELGTVPPDLNMAAAMQVATWYRRRKDFGVDAVAFPQGGAIKISKDIGGYLPVVRETFDSYRRFASVY